MKEIKLTIDGKEVQLTDEQLRALGIETKRKNPFDRVKQGEKYFAPSNEDTYMFIDYQSDLDAQNYNYAAYFNEDAFAKQVALHQLLYRKLLKFAYDNGYEDNNSWDGDVRHWTVRYDFEDQRFEPDWFKVYKYRDIYFSDREGAEHAIKEVVEPFMQEHPEFVW